MIASEEFELRGLKPRTIHKEDKNAEHESKAETKEIVMSKSDCATEHTISGFIQTNQESQLKTENIPKRKPRLGQPKKSRSCCGQFFPSSKPWKRHDDQIHPK